ncbi:response regulator [Aurantivibrio infirmus]
MSLNTIQNHILQPFVDETLENLQTMAKMNGHTDPGFLDDPKQFRFKGCAICCETSGHIDGVVLMHHYPETAIAMGNAIRLHVLGEDNTFEELNEDMEEALTEWSNTVIGLATRNLSHDHLGIKFEAPYFIQNTDEMDTLLEGVENIISVPVHVDDVGRFYFNYLIRSVSLDEAAPVSSNKISQEKKILVVDDMKLIRRSIVKFLGELGYNNIVQAENGKNAIEVYEAEKPDFMFMDVVMPEMNGNEVLNQIRQTDKDTPVVMLSSVADQEVIDECESLGIAGYILKPLTVETGAKSLGQYLI